jgi:hypothetical protein
MPIEHFKSKTAEMKNLAYRHAHGIPYTAVGAVVDGKYHAVKHSKDPKRIKIDNAQRKKEAKRKK